MRKAPDAFRTISEAAELLETPAHVLRFWESKFPQIKPVKRAGGRRYYRRIDIDLLSGIKLLLHDQGMTIRGVQKLLSEKGPRHVAELSPFADDVFDGDTDAAELVTDAIDMVSDNLPLPAVTDTDAPLDMAPQRPSVPEGPSNAFGTLGDTPVTLPRKAERVASANVTHGVQAAKLADMLRRRQILPRDSAGLFPVTTRLEALVARMTAQVNRDSAR